eukprot:scaffold442_cov110-Cylindrotheca_fusiformis.AAC.3
MTPSRLLLPISTRKGILALIVVLVLLIPPTGGRVRRPPRYTEEERQAEYERRGYKFPIEKFNPDTPGWTALMSQRVSQIMANPNSQERWDGWIQTMSSALTVPNFTEYGWGLTHAPEDLTHDIQQAIYEGLPNAREEGKIDVIDGPQVPLFIDRPDLTQRVLRELQPILEAWSGIELEPYTAYGFRLYRNESRLWMHVDKTTTHVISCIYHIASSENAKPWPITIEDYHGNTNSVVLSDGDILLYESAKNFHGRPQKFNGDWYTSIFVHYHPKEGWLTKDRDIESHYAIPPNWREQMESPFPELKWVGTSATEPDCPDSWCHLLNAKPWEGPGEYGMVMTGGGKKYSLHLDGSSDDDEEL